MNAWTLSADEYARTREKIAKLNDRARRRGFTGGFTIIGTPTSWQETNSAGIEVTRHGVEARITGQPACYAGWTFLAAVDTLQTPAGPSFVVRAAPGVEQDSIDRTQLKASYCAHCQSTRARRSTYLVQHEDSRTLQVGSSCLKDFLGWDGKPVFHATKDLEEELFASAGPSEPDYSTSTVIATAWAAVQVDGWRPSAHPASTRSTVAAALLGTSRADNDTREDLAPHMPAGAELAPQIISTLLDTLGASDYEVNLRAALQASALPERLYGIAVSAIPAYGKAIGAERNHAPEPQPSEWAGSIDQPLTVTGAVTTALTIDGYAYRATSRLVIIRTAAAVFKVISAASWAYDVSAGDGVTVTGTVKAHDTWREEKQTVLRRVKRVHPGAATTPAAT